ncbi:MAG: K(+)-transporting ATPase subunit F [Cyanosarcina radialis HA8281-LM2]|nr:K(+)-transporting ATPase subunit F [Cyanosarcina radialis HA8281-LM2]
MDIFLTQRFAKVSAEVCLATRFANARVKLPLGLFLGLCFNLAIASGVYAATGQAIDRGQAYAIALLGLLTLGLSIYLFVAIFQPERF